MVFESFKSHLPDSDIMIQTPGMSESERNEFLNRYRSTSQISLVGFAVMGGVFGEGIDLVGERLSGAVVVGVGLPGISLEKELIKDYFSHTHNAGFEFAYQYPGINRVFQAIDHCFLPNGSPSGCRIRNSLPRNYESSGARKTDDRVQKTKIGILITDVFDSVKIDPYNQNIITNRYSLYI